MVNNNIILDSLIKDLLENGCIIDFPKELHNLLAEKLKELFRNGKVKSYQIGNLGNCGYCVYVNENNIVLPIQNPYQFALAC